ncbi:hypothetical protein IT084_15680 [Desulfallas sp. Bu1-1]|jgi:hypothetical protein|uniref:hypothetical protein n=1 Tax=Desulfallas sp. Bu1-1 TaxID=2787620 RepID=UPI00189FD25D|nr:hypothetical protein [Desulfallas sp. Bu1-1]MBF7084393.1 hypothetical protein [Desulfallas sp. Bu1-1]
MLALKDLEMTCEEEELTPDEMARVAEGERELKAGLGVKYEQSIWDDLEDEEVDKIYEELYLSHTGSS